MNFDLQKEAKLASKQASALSRQALETHRGGNTELSLNLMKKAVIASKKCQACLDELRKAKN